MMYNGIISRPPLVGALCEIEMKIEWGYLQIFKTQYGSVLSYFVLQI